MKKRKLIGATVALMAAFLAFEPQAGALPAAKSETTEASSGAFAPPGYVKVFEDHFDGPDLDPDHWTFGLRDPDTGDLIPGAHGDHLLNTSYDGYATEEDTYIDDGALVLRNQKRTYVGTSPPGTYEYTTGWVMSMHRVSFNQGYIEFRARFPRGDKVWPALWLIPESLTWPPEWDLWEYFGFRSDVGYDVMGTHLATGPDSQNVTWYDNWLHDYDATYGNQEWHVYGFEWTDSGASWWIDGELVHSLDASGVSMYPDEDFYMVMNNGTRTESPDADTEWPNHLVVDYVEIYELSDEEPPEEAPPMTSHELDPQEPGPSGSYEEPVEVTLSATDPGSDPSGVERTKYRVSTDGEAGDWTISENADDADPFETSFTVSDEGVHVVEYRSIDNAGNEEDVRSVDFEIDSESSEPPPALEPDLRVSGRPSLRRIRPNRRHARYRFIARNVGDGPSGTVRLCARGPARRVRTRGNRCVVRQIPASAARGHSVVVRIRPAARGKLTRIRLIARGPDIQNRQTAVRLRVGR